MASRPSDSPGEGVWSVTSAPCCEKRVGQPLRSISFISVTFILVGQLRVSLKCVIITTRLVRREEGRGPYS